MSNTSFLELLAANVHYRNIENQFISQKKCDLKKNILNKNAAKLKLLLSQNNYFANEIWTCQY